MLFRVLGLGYSLNSLKGVIYFYIYTIIMANQMEKNMENEMETASYYIIITGLGLFEL